VSRSAASGRRGAGRGRNAPAGHRGRYCVGIQLGVPAVSCWPRGCWARSLAARRSFFAWVWRVPFLLSAGAAAVGVYVRFGLVLTAAFQRMEAARRGGQGALLGCSARPPCPRCCSPSSKPARTSRTTCSRYSAVYVTSVLHLRGAVRPDRVLIAAAAEFIPMPASRILSDRIGPAAGVPFLRVFLALYAFPVLLAGRYAPEGADLGGAGDRARQSALGGLLAAGPLYTEHFPTRSATTCASFAYQVCSAIWGAGFVVATALITAPADRAFSLYVHRRARSRPVCALLLRQNHRRRADGLSRTASLCVEPSRTASDFERLEDTLAASACPGSVWTRRFMFGHHVAPPAGTSATPQLRLPGGVRDCPAPRRPWGGAGAAGLLGEVEAAATGCGAGVRAVTTCCGFLALFPARARGGGSRCRSPRRSCCMCRIAWRCCRSRARCACSP